MRFSQAAARAGFSRHSFLDPTSRSGSILRRISERLSRRARHHSRCFKDHYFSLSLSCCHRQRKPGSHIAVRRPLSLLPFVRPLAILSLFYSYFYSRPAASPSIPLFPFSSLRFSISTGWRAMYRARAATIYVIRWKSLACRKSLLPSGFYGTECPDRYRRIFR